MKRYPTKTLVVCRSITDIGYVHKITRKDGVVWVVSDDVRVQNAVDGDQFVAGTLWLTRNETLFEVSDDVIALLNIVNDWFLERSAELPELPKELFPWIQHCEGGLTTQRIQDTLLLIRSYREFLDQPGLEKLFIIHHPAFHWEDTVLEVTAASLGIQVVRLGLRRPKVVFYKLWSWLRHVMKEGYFFLDYVWARLTKPNIPGLGQQNDVLFQLCGNMEKHRAHTMPIAKALLHIGHKPVILCWQGTRNIVHFKREGIAVDLLEKYLPVSEYLLSWIYFVKVWRVFHHHRYHFCAHSRLFYGKIPLGSILWPSVQAFTFEISYRYRVDVSARHYAKTHDHTAIRVWTSILFEGTAFQRHVIRHQKKRPLFFANWGFAYYDNPYMKKLLGRDLELALGPRHVRFLENLHVPLEKITMVGGNDNHKVAEFKQKNTREDSLRFIGIPTTYERYVVYDASNIVLGYTSARESKQHLSSLISVANRFPERMALVVKPHPGHRNIADVREQLTHCRGGNAYLLDKNTLPHHALNIGDLLVTKHSTIGWTAMHFQLPIFAVLLDSDVWRCLYEDAAEYIHSAQELEDKLVKMMTQPELFAIWKQEQNQRQRHFLTLDSFDNSSRSPAELAAMAIHQRICQS